MMHKKRLWVSLAGALCAILAAVLSVFVPMDAYSLDDIPPFSDSPYVVLDNNQPDFKRSDLVTESYEEYGQLDALGRCTYAVACIGQDLMPTQERESISQVRPTGWQSVKYDFVNGKNLYNRCHLIGFQLTGENANASNLITGTRYMNVEGMLPFENMVADYIRETNNHVLYRAEPIYDGMDLVARGVILQAVSVEDQGAGICFRVFVFNNQPGVQIDYATGESYALNGESALSTYILNTSSLKIHTEMCPAAATIQSHNKEKYTGTLKTLQEKGYTLCGSCNPQ